MRGTGSNWQSVHAQLQDVRKRFSSYATAAILFPRVSALLQPAENEPTMGDSDGRLLIVCVAWPSSCEQTDGTVGGARRSRLPDVRGRPTSLSLVWQRHCLGEECDSACAS